MADLKIKMNVSTEAQAKELFGDDANKVKHAIFKAMIPPKVSQKIESWEFENKHFKTKLKNNAEDGWDYIIDDKTLSIKSTGMAWDGNKTKSKADSIIGDFEEKKAEYTNALGSGINITIKQDNGMFKKNIEIESLASLGIIPEEAEYLEFSFELDGDFTFPEGIITEDIPLGSSFLRPIIARDTSLGEDIVDSGAFGIIEGKIVTKKIPVSWLKQATFPVITDLTIAFGSESKFHDTESKYCTVGILDSTHFVVAYQKQIGDVGQAVIGEFSGTTITSFGTASTFEALDCVGQRIAVLDSTHFVISYIMEDQVGGWAIVGETDGDTTIDGWGTAGNWDAGSVSVALDMDISTLDSTHFVIVFISSYGTPNVYRSARCDDNRVTALDSTHFVVAYQAQSIGKSHAIIGVTSGTTISSYGSESEFFSSASYSIDVAKIDSTHFIVAYSGTSNYVSARVAVFSGTTISSWGSESVANSDYSLNISVCVLSTTEFVVNFSSTASYYGVAIVGTMSGTTISSWDTPSEYSNGRIEYSGIAKIDSENFVIVSMDVNDGGDGYAIIGTTALPPVTRSFAIIIT